MQFVAECGCLNRDCKRQHAFTRAWLCLCNDPACKELVHYDLNDDEDKKNNKIDETIDEKPPVK